MKNITTEYHYFYTRFKNNSEMLLRHCENSWDRNKLNTVLFYFTSRYTNLHFIELRHKNENINGKM